MFRLIISCLLCGTTAAVIYKLNVIEYNKMPALFKLDDYDKCFLEPGGTYCIVDVNLFSRKSSKLMNTIQEYSEYRKKHFNHTEIHRGICVNTTCGKFMQNTSKDLSEVVETCLHNSIWEDHGLDSNISTIQYCNVEGKIIKLDTSDIGMIIIYCILIMLNIAGSLYDIFICKCEEKTGNKFLLAFSLRRNWLKLTSSGGAITEPRLERLKVLHGLRTMTMICVFFAHTVLSTSFSYVNNPLYIETAYEDPLKHILFNGTLVTHTFFVMSSFLLAYNFEIHSEKTKITWWQLPKGILLRWLRLTPTYALILGTISTVMRYAGNGPLWKYVVVSESLACRQYWWAHLLFINNYIYDDAFCAPQTWYLAADTQLFCLGLMVCIFARRRKVKVLTLLILFVLSLLISAVQTYFENLDAVVIQSPEVYRSLYAHDDTFRLLYIRGHTNLSTYAFGLAGGFLTYYWQKKGKSFKQYKNYRYLIWLIFPLGLGVIFSGGIFYIDDWNASTAFKVFYATVYKPFFQFLVVILIISCVFKFEGIYRGILEWRGFTWTGRVSYSAFLLHTLFQRGYVGIQTTPIYMSDYYVMLFLSATIFLTYGTGTILWLCVEAPAANLTRVIMSISISKRSDNTNRDVELSKV